MACLYGMASDPADLILSLLLHGDAPFLSALALHAFLSNPLPKEQQFHFLKELLIELPPKEQLVSLRYLYTQRPSLAANLSEQLFKDEARNPKPATAVSNDPSDLLENLTQLTLTAEAKNLLLSLPKRSSYWLNPSK